MSENSLGSFTFITADINGYGGVPPVQQTQLQPIQRPGQDGTAFILTGAKGQPFQMRTFVDVNTYANAHELSVSYQTAARGSAYTLIHGGINYETAHATKYVILAVNQVNVRAVSAAKGGLVGSPGATVEAVWTLIPVAAS